MLVSDPLVAKLAATLDPDEQIRAARYRFAEHRRRFAAARGGLRSLLAKYLGCTAREIVFAYNAHGRPELAYPAAPSLRFNVSHSSDTALYAFTGLPAVGVDLERHRKVDRLAELAERYFAPAEFAAWEALPPTDRVAGFFAAWTRKEAYIKAHGRGLSYPLDQFVVSLRPGEPARLLATLDDPSEAARWRLENLPAAPGFSAALAAAAGDWSVQCLELDWGASLEK